MMARTRRVLLVDDSRVTREVMKVGLIVAGMEVMDAADGEEALQVIRTQRPDAVVADLEMPKLDGPALCRAIGQDPSISNTPVVIVTSHREFAARAECIKAGARAVLNKPLTPRALLDELARL